MRHSIRVGRWMVLALVSGLLLSMGAPRAVRAQTPSDTAGPVHFANIPWGLSRAATRTAMEAHGFRFLKIDDDSDMVFKGALLGDSTMLFAWMARGHLSRISMALITDDDAAIPTYNQLKTSLTEKYGPPTGSIANFDEPFEAGDGYELTAIRTGKGHYLTIWMLKGRDHGGLSIDISKLLVVDVSYEADSWSAESKRRQAKAMRIF